MGDLKIGVIGIGSMGKKYVSLLYEKKVKGIELAAVSSRSEENKNWCSKKLKSDIPVYGSVEEMFAHKKENGLEAVLVVTPHRAHPKIVLQAFSHGLSVFCDKPAGICAKDAKRMNEAAEESGCAYAMMFHKRAMPIYQEAKKLVDSGVIGKIEKVYWKNTLAFRTRCYHDSSSWRSSWSGEGGGLLINQAQHELDLMQWIVGMPVKVKAEIDFGRYNDFLVDDDSTLFFDYPNGAKGIFYASTGEPIGEERIEFTGTKAKILISENILEVFWYDMPSDQFRIENRDPFGKMGCRRETTRLEMTENPYQVMLENFAAHVKMGVPLIADGRDGLKTLELTNGSYLSAWNGKWITLPIEDESYMDALRKRCEEEERMKKDKRLL